MFRFRGDGWITETQNGARFFCDGRGRVPVFWKKLLRIMNGTLTGGRGILSALVAPLRFYWIHFNRRDARNAERI